MFGGSTRVQRVRHQKLVGMVIVTVKRQFLHSSDCSVYLSRLLVHFRGSKLTLSRLAGDGSVSEGLRETTTVQ